MSYCSLCSSSDLTSRRPASPRCFFTTDCNSSLSFFSRRSSIHSASSRVSMSGLRWPIQLHLEEAGRASAPSTCDPGSCSLGPGCCESAGCPSSSGRLVGFRCLSALLSSSPMRRRNHAHYRCYGQLIFSKDISSSRYIECTQSQDCSATRITCLFEAILPWRGALKVSRHASYLIN